MGAKSLLAIVLLMAAVALSADAQVPAHAPGTICFTPTFWCWAQPPGQTGTRCFCPGAQGRAVAGVRG